MKVALITLALISLGCAAPQPRKLFHEHFEDFLDVIIEEIGDQMTQLTDAYLEYDEFWVAINYMQTNSFKDLVAEMESLPEFQAVVEFLENDNIDIHYFLDLFHEILDTLEVIPKKGVRQSTSGTDFTSYINDVIAMFPKDKLAALYEEKMASDEEFRVAMENLFSPEWESLFAAIWDSEIFQAEVQTLGEYGIDVSVLIIEVIAVFGQNLK